MWTTTAKSTRDPRVVNHEPRLIARPGSLARIGRRIAGASAAAGVLLATLAISAASQEEGSFGNIGPGGIGSSASQQTTSSSRSKAPQGTTTPESPRNEPGALSGADDKPQPPAAARSIPSLDEMLAAALIDNPDIRVAEANLRAAEAEVNRVRLGVVQKVIEFRQKWEAQNRLVEQAEVDTDKASKLVKSRVASQEMAQLAQREVTRARAKLAEIEAELPYLIGRSPPSALRSGSSGMGPGGMAGMGMDSGDMMMPGPMGMAGGPMGGPMGGGPMGGMYGGSTGRAGLSGPAAGGSMMSGIGTSGGLSQSPMPGMSGGMGRSMSGAMSRDDSSRDASSKRGSAQTQPAAAKNDRLREALQSTLTAKYEDTPVLDVLRHIRDEQDIRFVIQPQFKKDLEGLHLTLDLGEVPIGLLLEALSDTLYIAFDVRDYGILVSLNPYPGESNYDPASSVRRLWRSKDNTEGSDAKPASKN